ncbi:hypothetical protein NDU88_004899 [Pleurodeles waltl]|uniref:Uncharacterized protein n=1 Tax=Pleurodeles waltl TaxID=8319 RepID=A0AAV7MYJ3_PLEWA|nr:hypothetical protein NDU88_004899 [Pleurodeles waltl]
MEEDQVVEQQDELKAMIAHMRTEALKRGKDWLRTKMGDRSEEHRDQETPAAAKVTDDMAPTERTPSPSQKAHKRQKTEGKPTRKTTKRPRGPAQSAEETTAPNPGPSLARAPAEGEHISAIITECFKSLAPLLMRAKGGGRRERPHRQAAKYPGNSQGTPFQWRPISSLGRVNSRIRGTT